MCAISKTFQLENGMDRSLLYRRVGCLLLHFTVNTMLVFLAAWIDFNYGNSDGNLAKHVMGEVRIPLVFLWLHMYEALSIPILLVIPADIISILLIYGWIFHI